MEKTAQNSAPVSSPIGWYFHLPFCRSKCHYCDFYSEAIDRRDMSAFVAALLLELRLRRPARAVDTVYIGGGTPTVLPDDQLYKILDAIAGVAGPVTEFTIEANPESVEEGKLRRAVAYGVNRLSLGAQSFVADELALLGRCHEPQDIARAVQCGRAAGVANLGLDLIFAIPGQSLGSWRTNLLAAIELEPQHLSCYALTYEEGTRLAQLRNDGKHRPADESLEAEMFELAIHELMAAGYEHYEISNFAKPGCRCRANEIYWDNREYLGVGPSAVSYLDGVRRRNVADVRRYVEGLRVDPSCVVEEEERLSPLERAGETAVQMLRLTRGIDPDLFRQLTGFDAYELFAVPIARFVQLGLMKAEPSSIHLTRRGMLVANQVMVDFLPEPPGRSP